MKKLLLFIVPMLLFFGISLGNTDTFLQATTVAPSCWPTSVWKTVWVMFYPKYNWVLEPEFYLISWNTANTVRIYEYNNTSVFICSWSVSWKTWTFNTCNLTWWIVYSIILSSWATSYYWWQVFTHCLWQNSNQNGIDTNMTWFLIMWWAYYAANWLAVGWASTYIWFLQSINWISYTYTIPTNTTTIRYNWTSTGFAWSNIYLNGNFWSYSFSGTDIIFNYLSNTFRILHRSH